MEGANMEIVIAFALGVLVGLVACAAWVQGMAAALTGMAWGTRRGLAKSAVSGLELPNFRSPPAAIQWIRLVTSGQPGMTSKGYRRRTLRHKKCSQKQDARAQVVQSSHGHD